LLREAGVPVSEGRLATTPDEAREIAAQLGRPVVVKAQILVTKRASLGGIQFASDPEEAAQAAGRMLGAVMGGISVEKVLVEARQDVKREYFASIFVDDTHQGPVLLCSLAGGTGIEELARTQPGKVVILPIDQREGLHEFQARNVLIDIGVPSAELAGLAEILVKLYKVARKYEARSAEINPLALLADGRFLALDARVAVDDNAIYRHPELGIEVAREFSHPATNLEKTAYLVESKDYRGTFYFTQLRVDESGDGIWVGFHGAGGGGAMMAMDALSRGGLNAADFCDTSGNPPASKVYRAARIILSQPGIQGYFFAGSGVASQEQYHLARGLVKAFKEVGLSVPAVLRFGGNSEDLAVEIVNQHAHQWPGPTESYTRIAGVDACAARMKEMIGAAQPGEATTKAAAARATGAPFYRFATLTGAVVIDHGLCQDCTSKSCVAACPASLLKVYGGLPVLVADAEAVAKGKCVECLACELACDLHGKGALVLDLPLPQVKQAASANPASPVSPAKG
jgi:succinyl-CoA synthetase beta subunit